MHLLLIHSKSEKGRGVYFSVSKHLRKKCINLYDNILRQRCVNHPNSKNFVSKGIFCWGYTLFKCLNLIFKQWLNIIWVILQFYLWKQWNLDSFCVLSQSFCGKFKIICGVRTPGSPTFRMYAAAVKCLHTFDKTSMLQVLSRCSLSTGGNISVKQFLEVFLSKICWMTKSLAGARECRCGTKWTGGVEAGEDGGRVRGDREGDVLGVRQEVGGLQQVHGGREEEWHR